MKRLAFLFSCLSLTSHAAEPPSKPLHLILLTPFVDYSFFDPIKQGMKDAARGLGVEVIFTGVPDGNTRALADKVREAVGRRYDGIALNITDSAALNTVVAEALGKGIPVIAFNVDDNRPPTARLAAIGQDMKSAGRTFGKALAPLIPARSRVLLTMHDPNISALNDRAEGAQEVLKAKKLSWTILITGTEPNEAQERVRVALAGDPSIKVVLSTGSADTEAAGRAIERYFAGRSYVAAGFDLSPAILRLVKAKIITLTVDQQPYAQGYYAVVELTLYRRFGLRPPNIDTGAVLITADNADQVAELSRQHYR